MGMAAETPNKLLARSGRFRHPCRHDTLKNARPKFLVLFRKSTRKNHRAIVRTHIICDLGKPPRGSKRENGDITLQIYVNNIAHAYILRGARHCSLHRPRVPRNGNALQSPHLLRPRDILSLSHHHLFHLRIAPSTSG